MFSIIQSLLFIFSMYLIPTNTTPLSPPTEYTILPSSSLYIKGSSNISNFVCNFEMKYVNPVKVLYDNTKSTMETQYTEFPVAYFDCGSAAINKDFRSLLKEKVHPTLFIRLVSVNPVSDSQVKVSLEFKIAGVTNMYELVVDYKLENQRLHTQGSFQLNIEDYNLEQPKRLLGLVVVRKEIEVHFDIDFV